MVKSTIPAERVHLYGASYSIVSSSKRLIRSDSENFPAVICVPRFHLSRNRGA